jgi:SH3-like domain-containing protein
VFNLPISGFICGVVLAFGLASPVAAQVVPGEEHCVVNVGSDDRLNIRSSPSATAPIEARKRYGTCGLEVTGPCQGNWCPVSDIGASGWAHKRYLSMVSPAMYCVSGISPGDVLNLRAFPSPQSRVIRALNRRQCDIAFLPYAVGGWQKIRVQGLEGWAARRYLSSQ